jgi:hypothetical protein
MLNLTDLKRITYVHPDFEAAFGENVIGYFKSNLDAENALNAHTLDLIMSGAIPPEDDPPLPNPLPDDADPPCAGAAIGRMWHKQPRDFIAVLRQLDMTARVKLAESYAEWRGTDATAVFDLWTLAVQGANVPANARS